MIVRAFLSIVFLVFVISVATAGLRMMRQANGVQLYTGFLLAGAVVCTVPAGLHFIFKKRGEN